MSLPPANPAARPEAAATRELLLHAAGAVFAERGFQASTIREICQRAGANVAAVNYHFGDKETLYLEALRHAQAEANRRYPLDEGLTARASPEQQLHAFVRGMLRRILDPGQHAWVGRLMARELIEPTAALDRLVKERLRPTADQLLRIVAALAGPGASPAVVRLSAFSVMGQCVFYNHCRAAVCRMFPDQKFGPDEIERLAAHITEFSAVAIRRLGRKAARRRG